MIKSWIVRQFKNEYNPMHIHSGHVSELDISKCLRIWVKLWLEKIQNEMENYFNAWIS